MEIWRKNIVKCLSFQSCSNEITSDVIIHCKNGTISTHQLVLASLSPMMYQILKTMSSEEKLTILMPEFGSDQAEDYFSRNCDKDEDYFSRNCDKDKSKIKEILELKDIKDEFIYDDSKNSIKDNREYHKEDSDQDPAYDSDFTLDGEELTEDQKLIEEECKVVNDPVVISINKSSLDTKQCSENKKIFLERFAWYHFSKTSNKTQMKKGSITCKYCNRIFKVNLKQIYQTDKIIRKHIMRFHQEKITEEQHKHLLEYCSNDIDEVLKKKVKKIIGKEGKAKTHDNLLDPETGQMSIKTNLKLGPRIGIREKKRTNVVWKYMSCDSLTGEAKCQFCDRTFSYSKSMANIILRHLVKSHDILEKEESLRISLFCAICGKSHGSTLERQKCEENHQNRKIFACTFEGCGKEFNLQSKLERHKNIHNSVSCQFCGKEFKQSKIHLLYAHLRVHSDDVPYECEVCGKSFKFHGGLGRHQKKHHPNFVTENKKRKFECLHCGIFMKSKMFLHIHMKKKHGDEESKGLSRPSTFNILSSYGDLG